MSEDIKRVPYEEHPNRCQANVNIGGGQQCMFYAVEGGTNCPIHGGSGQKRSQEKESLRNYNLTRWNAQLQRHASSPGIKSLRDEVGILRMMMEERLNMCRDNMDLILHSGPIADMVMKIERLVVSCHKLEGSLGQLLDKTAVLQFASQVIDVIASELSGQDQVINTIADKIVSLVAATSAEIKDQEAQ
jgi:hypothetical protein